MKRLFSALLLLFLLLPVWGVAGELPSIYTTPHGMKDSTVMLYIPAKYYSRVHSQVDGLLEVLDARRLCKDYTGDSECYLMSLENAGGHNIIGTSKTDAPFVYVTITPEGGEAGITIIGGWNEN